MGLMSNKIGRDELRPGDHIYTWRSGYFYSHHGIYVGDGKVIHLTRGPGLISISGRSSDDRVLCCDMEDFPCRGKLYRFEYGVSRFEFLMKRPGTCSFASSDPPEKVLHRASYLLEYGFGNYNLLSRNCEGFAIYCKTGFIRPKNGASFSGQISSLFAYGIAVTIIPYGFLPACLIGVALVVCGLYCFVRLGNDAGWGRHDFEVVEVEKLADLSDAQNIRENMNMMENSTTRWFLRERYDAIIVWAIRIWYWTPENTILLWFKSCFYYILLSYVVSNQLKLHGFKLGEYSAYAIWLLGHLYWRWTSVSTILLWTRSFFLLHFLSLHDFDRPQEQKLGIFDDTLWLFILSYWTPRIIIRQWIKLALVYPLLLLHRISELLRNHRLMLWEAFFACFVTSSHFLATRLQ